MFIAQKRKALPHSGIGGPQHLGQLCVCTPWNKTFLLKIPETYPDLSFHLDSYGESPVIEENHVPHGLCGTKKTRGRCPTKYLTKGHQSQKENRLPKEKITINKTKKKISIQNINKYFGNPRQPLPFSERFKNTEQPELRPRSVQKKQSHFYTLVTIRNGNLKGPLPISSKNGK